MSDPVQEQLIAARRNQILDAAVTVFARKGFHPTTIKDIAREAGIADGTIYNYFKNKTALILGIFERMRDTVVQEVPLAQVTEVDLRTFVQAFLAFPLVALREDNFELFRIILSEALVNDELRDLYRQQIMEPSIALGEQYLAQLVEQGHIKPIDVPLTVRILTGNITGIILAYLTGDAQVRSRLGEIPDVLTTLVLQGLEQTK